MAHGYKLASKAASAAAGFIPSLIGVKADQRVPGPSDTYFTRVELPGYAAGSLTSIEKTHMVDYDSLPLEIQDPILTCRGPGQAFYIPAREALELADATGDTLLREMVARLLPRHPQVV